jgi:hypothetical protein
VIQQSEWAATPSKNSSIEMTCVHKQHWSFITWQWLWWHPNYWYKQWGNYHASFQWWLGSRAGDFWKVLLLLPCVKHLKILPEDWPTTLSTQAWTQKTSSLPRNVEICISHFRILKGVLMDVHAMSR